MFLWAILLKHPDHLIISKHTGCYAGCLRHGYQRSIMCLKRRAFPTPHTYMNVWRGLRRYTIIRLAQARAQAVVINRIQMFMDLTETVTYIQYTYIKRFRHLQWGCSFYNETFLERWRTEGETYLSPSGREQIENPEEPPALHCRRARSVSLCVWERNRFWSHTLSLSPSSSLLPSPAASVV